MEKQTQTSQLGFDDEERQIFFLRNSVIAAKKKADDAADFRDECIQALKAKEDAITRLFRPI